VNATDLRLMKYPSRSVLMKLGEWAMGQKELSEAMLDDELRKIGG
jgi:adenine-specific DNA-methyltransferase